MEHTLAILRYDSDLGTVLMLDAFWLLDVPVAQGDAVPFEVLMEYDYQFLSDYRHAPPTGDGSPQADGVP